MIQKKIIIDLTDSVMGQMAVNNGISAKKMFKIVGQQCADYYNGITAIYPDNKEMIGNGLELTTVSTKDRKKSKPADPNDIICHFHGITTGVTRARFIDNFRIEVDLIKGMEYLISEL